MNEEKLYFVIDGLNVLNYGKHAFYGKYKHSQKEKNVKAMLSFIERISPRAEVVVIFPHFADLTTQDWATHSCIHFLEKNKKQDDDIWILNTAISNNAFIISNDKFKEYKSLLRFVEKRIVPFEIINDRFIIDWTVIIYNLTDLIEHDIALQELLIPEFDIALAVNNNI